MDKHEIEILLHKDRQYVWHPFTQMKDYAEQDHLLIERADGVFLYDADGNRYYDTNSSWWVNIHGHGHPRLRSAMLRQMEQTDHIMFSGMTHKPGIELAERLIEIAPDGLNKVFYSDNGSTAVEVALKMSFQYWQHKGKKEKSKFVYMEHSYHGDTIGAVSVGGVELFHSTFRPLLFHAYQVPSPAMPHSPVHTLADQRSSVHTSTEQLGSAQTQAAQPDSAQTLKAQADHVTQCVDEVRRLFEAHASQIAAFIVEPMIQAAGGMLMYPAAYLKQIRELCTAYDVHLIADEVAVGFGRTGRMFGCDHAGVSPDLMCLSKGLTAGIMPLSATLCSDEIYMAFYDDFETLKTFFHGHSFTGNPLAAAVALESLKLFQEERLLDRVQSLSSHLANRLSRFEQFSHAANIRSLGLVGAFDLYEDKTSRQKFDFTKRTGYRVYLEGLNEGLILRPLGDTIYFWLPLCITEEQINDIAERTERVLERLNLT